MALIKIRNLASIAVSGAPAGAQLCEISDDEGSICHGYERTGVLTVVAVVTPSAARLARMSAERAPGDATDTKYANAQTVVRNQVARVRAIAAGSRTDQDRWLMALSYLVFREE